MMPETLKNSLDEGIYLCMPDNVYSTPVARLLTWGDIEDKAGDAWPDYVGTLGLTSEHIPELIRLATDEDLRFNEEDDHSYEGPRHAWRALGQLKAIEAATPLLQTFAWDDDYPIEELPKVYGMLGPEAIPALATYLAENADEDFLPMTASACLMGIAKERPEAREQVITVITDQLKHYKDNNPTINGDLIGDLTELKASEALPLMEEAFKAGAVDFDMIDWETVQHDFGLISDEEFQLLDAKNRERRRARMLAQSRPDRSPGTPGKPKKAKALAKTKRKMAKESRKKNRKKK